MKAAAVKGGAIYCHRVRGGEVVQEGRDSVWDAEGRKRREGVARSEFPVQDRVVINQRRPFAVRGCGWPRRPERAYTDILKNVPRSG